MISKVKVYERDIKRISSVILKNMFSEVGTRLEMIFKYSLKYREYDLYYVTSFKLTPSKDCASKVKTKIEKDRTLLYLDVNDLYENPINTDSQEKKIVGHSISKLSQDVRKEILSEYGANNCDYDTLIYHGDLDKYCFNNEEYKKDKESLCKQLDNLINSLKFCLDAGDDKVEAVKTLKAFKKYIDFDDKHECPICMFDLNTGEVMIPTKGREGKKGWMRCEFDRFTGADVDTAFWMYKLMVSIEKNSDIEFVRRSYDSYKYIN